mmetsp:Transcript_19772/g.78736  ORF Transcript_19772/g.78736 Transcript_19772/m.78736 type:complete len:248 (+) Transcript_19772:506-1249(+)
MVSTSMYVETLEGETMGEIHMDWHLYRRRYNLYVNKEQFARVDSGFLAVDFDMRDDQDKKMASVNKDFTGFGREIFTDARQYVVRLKADYSGEDLSPDALVQENAKPDPNDIFSDSSKLSINQKATILACAISIDFDYFSIHSRTGGGLMGGGFPIFMPFPGTGGGAPAEGGEPMVGYVSGKLSGLVWSTDDQRILTKIVLSLPGRRWSGNGGRNWSRRWRCYRWGRIIGPGRGLRRLRASTHWTRK